MKQILLLTAAILLGTTAVAQQGNPGGNFIENWDMNEDGQVTLAEATERRGDIFVTFDEDDNGFLSASDYAMFEEARASHKDSAQEGQRQGKGQGQGKGRGRGRGQGGGPDRENQGMSIDFNDINADGQVSRDEFMTRTSDWYKTMDRNGDGTITVADFGRGRG